MILSRRRDLNVLEKIQSLSRNTALEFFSLRVKYFPQLACRESGLLARVSFP